MLEKGSWERWQTFCSRHLRTITTEQKYPQGGQEFPEYSSHHMWEVWWRGEEEEWITKCSKGAVGKDYRDEKGYIPLPPNIFFTGSVLTRTGYHKLEEDIHSQLPLSILSKRKCKAFLYQLQRKNKIHCWFSGAHLKDFHWCGANVGISEMPLVASSRWTGHSERKRNSWQAFSLEAYIKILFCP